MNMSKRIADALKSLADPDRRTLLGLSAAGVAALLAPVLGGALATDAEAAQSGARVAVPPPSPKIRRVVTGLNGAGKSFIAVDDQVPVNSIYTTSADAPIGKSEGESRSVGKATSETRFFMAAIPPSKDPKPNLTNRLGFHQTMGIAYCFILNGELAFLTDTQETKVKGGDVVVERHTWHSWRNEGSEPVSMLITVVTTA
jgi:hypothetical protein